MNANIQPSSISLPPSPSIPSIHSFFHWFECLFGLNPSLLLPPIAAASFNSIGPLSRLFPQLNFSLRHIGHQLILLSHLHNLPYIPHFGPNPLCISLPQFVIVHSQQQNNSFIPFDEHFAPSVYSSHPPPLFISLTNICVRILFGKPMGIWPQIWLRLTIIVGHCRKWL